MVNHNIQTAIKHNFTFLTQYNRFPFNLPCNEREKLSYIEHIKLS